MYMLISCIQVYSLYYYFKMQKPVNTESKKQGRQKEFYVATFSENLDCILSSGANLISTGK